jgi:hypothetical protein
LSTQDQTIKEFTNKKKTIEANAAFISLVQKSESSITDCVNQRV